MALCEVAVVWKEVEFDAGHRIPNHKSQCRRFHGHRYRVRVGVEGPIQQSTGESEEGMVVDFGDLKRDLMKIHDYFDHKMVLYIDDPFAQAMRADPPTKELSLWEGLGIIVEQWIPTAENFAVFIYRHMTGKGYKVQEVQVYETPTSMASYTGEVTLTWEADPDAEGSGTLRERTG